MKKILHYCSVSIMLLCFICCRRSFSQSKFNKDEEATMLKDFYTQYIAIASMEGPLRIAELDSIRSYYCTKRYFNEINHKTINRELDYDPFLNAQFCISDWLKTLNIWKDTITNNIYYVSYEYENKLRITKLRVVKENESYKIDHIFLKDFREEIIEKH